jgi:hypothetical protein
MLELVFIICAYGNPCFIWKTMLLSVMMDAELANGTEGERWEGK